MIFRVKRGAASHSVHISTKYQQNLLKADVVMAKVVAMCLANELAIDLF